MNIGEVKDIIVAGAACFTAFIAYKGLNKWQKELKGRVYFDAAKDLMRAVYKFRDEMSYTRNGFILPYEFPKDYNPLNCDAKTKGDAYVYMYRNRMKPVIKAAKELDLCALEAEALWGKHIKEKCFKLRCTGNRLQHYIQTEIEDIYSNREDLKDISELKKRIRGALNESADKDDEFSKEIQNSIEAIEKIIRPYLDKNI